MRFTPRFLGGVLAALVIGTATLSWKFFSPLGGIDNAGGTSAASAPPPPNGASEGARADQDTPPLPEDSPRIRNALNKSTPQAAFVDAMGRRYEVNDREAAAGYGAFIEQALGSIDSRSSMKAAFLLLDCSKQAARLSMDFESVHGDPTNRNRQRLERTQLQQRKCQSIRTELHSELPTLLQRAMAGGEPMSAAFLLGHYNRLKVAPAPDITQKIRAGLERDAALGDMASLTMLAMLGNQLGIPPEKQVAFEIVWRVTSQNTSGANISTEEFMEQLLRMNDPASSAKEKEAFASKMPAALLALDRPELSSQQLKDARQVAEEMLKSILSNRFSN